MQVAINETCERRQWSQTKDKGPVEQDQSSYIEMHVTNNVSVVKVSNAYAKRIRLQISKM
jgi:hypothetical protein